MVVWAVIGASRGIGHEFVSQVLRAGDSAIVTVRNQSIPCWPDHEGKYSVYACDMLSPKSIDQFASELVAADVKRLDYVILNAGILRYPGRATEISYDDFLLHLQTNTIGPIITAQKLLGINLEIDTMVFISSDSGSAQRFNDFEDGFAAYAASKAALNQSLRHMAAELHRKGSSITIIALHPGEVKTDMANIQLGWEVAGQLTVTESVEQCIKTIKSKTAADHGTFWTWENEYPW